MILVPASRAWYVAEAPVNESMLYSALLPVQHAPLMFKWYPPWFAKTPGLNSGENSVAPPVAPIRNSFTVLAPSVERRLSDVVHRVDCWLPVPGNPGKLACRVFVVSGVELMWL